MLLTADSLRVPHGFFTREGGVSEGPYASLNCSLSSGDSRDAVSENRARACRAVGAEPVQLVGLLQVHGADVVAVTETWLPGAGPRADAMVTDRPGIALGIVTADCAPILFADARAGVVGAAHAGWRGAVGGVIEATVAAMVRSGAHPSSITAAGRTLHRPGVLRGWCRCARRRAGAGSCARRVLCRRAAGGTLAVRPVRLLCGPSRRSRRIVSAPAGRRHRRRRGAVLLASAAHAWRGWSDRAPDFHHHIGLKVIRAVLSFPAVVAPAVILWRPARAVPGQSRRQRAAPRAAADAAAGGANADQRVAGGRREPKVRRQHRGGIAGDRGTGDRR